MQNKKINFQTLSKNNKIAIGLTAVTGLTFSGVIAASSNKKEKHKNSQSPQQPIDNTYAMQMAQDISSYRYGKHMTGFVNR